MTLPKTDAADSPRLWRTILVAVAAFIAAFVLIWILNGLVDREGYFGSSAQYFRGRGAPLLVFVFAAIFLAAASPPTWKERAIALAALLATWLLAYLGILLGVAQIATLPPVSDAVGGAAYWGTPVIGAQLGAAATAAVLLLAAVGFAKLCGRSADASPVAVENVAEPTGSAREWLWIGLGTLICVAALTPRLGSSVLDSLRGAPPRWDFQNLIAWEWAIDRGLVPGRDFFFPYGGIEAFYRFPEGVVLLWLSKAATLGLVAWAIGRLSEPRERISRALVAVVVVVLLGEWSESTWRYAVPVAIVAAYASAGPLHGGRSKRTWAVIAAAFIGCGLYGLDLLGYAAVGCLAVASGELLSGNARLSWSTAKYALADLIPFCVALMGTLGIWWIRGSFRGNAQWWLDPGGVSAFGASDQRKFGALMDGIVAAPTVPMILTGITFLLLASGLLLTFQSGRRHAGAAAILLGAAGVSFAVLLKHLVRPQFDVLLIVPLLGFTWAAAVLFTRRNLLTVISCALLAGSFVALIQDRGGFRSLAEQAINAPSRVVQGLGMFGNPDALARADRRRFDAVVFPGWSVEPNLAAAVHQVTGPRKSFAVLGEAPGVYFLLKQPFPYHSDLYDVAPIGQQQEMVAAMRADPPDVLLWRRDAKIDEVPQTVRAPLVMAYAVSNYVPLRQYQKRGPSPFDILRRRRAYEAVDLAFWRDRLSSTEDLGFVPVASDALGSPRCHSLGRSCTPYAIVTGSARSRGEAVTVAVRGAGGSYRARFRALEGRGSYAIRLDRLWYWPFAGNTVRLAVENRGWTVKKTLIDTDALY